jgi:hypothetical protein
VISALNLAKTRFVVHFISNLCGKIVLCFWPTFHPWRKKDNILPYCVRLCAPHFLLLYHLDRIRCPCYVHLPIEAPHLHVNFNYLHSVKKIINLWTCEVGSGKEASWILHSLNERIDFARTGGKEMCRQLLFCLGKTQCW